MDEPYGAWVARRDDAVWGELGIATLASTNWLDATPRPVEGAPGLWHAESDVAVGLIDGVEVRLGPGEQEQHEGLTFRGFARDGATAVRVLDPGAPARRGVSRIERFAYDARTVAVGRIRHTPGAQVSTVSVDGHHAVTDYAAEVDLEWEGASIHLAVEGQPDGTLFAAFSDATSGADSYRFRFLRLPAPAADGTVAVDLNRAYLPPCAFSDHYVCVFPPPQNRLSVPVRVGEARVV